MARVVGGTRRRDHITPILAELHWLPFRAHITLKIATLGLTMELTNQPSQIVDLIADLKLRRELRSVFNLILTEPVIAAERARRSFRYSAVRT